MIFTRSDYISVNGSKMYCTLSAFFAALASFDDPPLPGLTVPASAFSLGTCADTGIRKFREMNRG